MKLMKNQIQDCGVECKRETERLIIIINALARVQVTFFFVSSCLFFGLEDDGCTLFFRAFSSFPSSSQHKMKEIH